jgi:hypothetical protein
VTSTDWTATIALILSAGALLLELRRWVESGVRIKLRVMADAISFPYDDKKEKLVLIVSNYGTMPTTTTHMVVHTFSSAFHRWTRKPLKSFIVAKTGISELPHKLESSDVWMGQMNYDDQAKALRNSRKLFVGVLCSNSDRTYLIRVPPKKSLGAQQVEA